MTKAATIKRQETVGQSREAGLSRRFIAYLIDWYLGGLVTAFPIAIFSMREFQTVQNQNILQFSAPYGILAGVLALLCAVLYYVIVPAFIWNGQTVAKRMLKIRIVDCTGVPARAGRIILRQLVGMLIIEGGLVTASTILHQMLTLVTGLELVRPLMYVGLVLSAVSAALVLIRGHRAIHDRLAGTQVVRLSD